MESGFKLSEVGYDIIGDVHGCALTLEKLLKKLGYQTFEGVYAHPQRKAVFLGDIIDRGPRIRESLHIVKSMVDHGNAYCILGNHEFNALAYTTTLQAEASSHTEQSTPPKYVREHSPRNARMIAETLEQFEPYPEEWQSFLQWFKTLPLFLEFRHFRAVHACWDNDIIEVYKEHYQSEALNDSFIRATADKTTFECRVVDRLTRGTDMYLPDQRKIEGRDGLVRRIFRTKFWARDPVCYQDVVFQPDPLPDDLAKRELTLQERDRLLSYGENDMPVFVGHYWLQGEPRRLRPNVACLDYSAVKYGRLVAYRFDGERELDNRKFEWVLVDSELYQGATA